MGIILTVLYVIVLVNLDWLFPVFAKSTWLFAIPRLRIGIILVLLMPIIPILLFLLSRQFMLRYSPRSWIGEPLLTEGYYYILGHIALMATIIAWIQFL